MLALIIQGPYSPASVRNGLINLAYVDELSIGGWKEDEASWKSLLDLLKFAGFKVHFSTSEKIQVDSKQIQRKQIQSTLAAIEKVHSPKSIKTRSDEYYNLSEFIVRIHQLSDSPKILTGNFPERPFSLNKFFVSDHLVGADTEVLKRAFEILATGRHGQNSPEVPFECQLGYALYLATCELLDSDPKQYRHVSWRDYINLIEVFDVHLLKPYLVNANTAGVKSISDIKKLGRLFNSAGLPIDYVYRKSTFHYFPKTRLVEAVLRLVRYVVRSNLSRKK